MTAAYDLSVVVAIEDSIGNLAAVMDALAPQSHPRVQFILGRAQGSADVSAAAAGQVNVQTTVLPAGSRIPHIWGQGIREAKAPYVGLLSGQFVPAADWVAQALALVWDDTTAAYGGVIANVAGASALDWAIFILRYGRFTALTTPGVVDDIAADNAVYRRDLVIAQNQLLERGFWEPDFHARFHAQGCALRAAPRLLARQSNQYSARQFAGQRYAHGTEFGLQRAATKTLPRRLLLLLLSPLLVCVFLAKVLAAGSANPQCRPMLLRALPWLLVFMACWGAGEARGYFRALRGVNHTN